LLLVVALLLLLLWVGLRPQGVAGPAADLFGAVVLALKAS
jgi:hypothetical protein